MTMSAERASAAKRRAIAQVVNKHNAKYKGFEINGPVFRVGQLEYPINMIAAEVAIGASTSSSRTTLTRVVGGGLVAGVGGALLGGAAKKSTDTSKIYLTVETPDGNVITRSAPVAEEKQAHFFASQLRSAASREWPLQTPFGQVDLDPTSQIKAGSASWVLLAPLALVTLSIGLGLSVHPAFLLGVLLAVIVWLVLLFVETTLDEKALDEADPGWRERKARDTQEANEAMWKSARGGDGGH